MCTINLNSTIIKLKLIYFIPIVWLSLVWKLPKTTQQIHKHSRSIKLKSIKSYWSRATIISTFKYTFIWISGRNCSFENNCTTSDQTQYKFTNPNTKYPNLMVRHICYFYTFNSTFSSTISKEIKRTFSDYEFVLKHQTMLFE